MKQLIWIWLFLTPAIAQQTIDEQTKDYEAEDARYYQRVRKAEEQEAREKARGTPEQMREAYLEKADALIRDRSYRSEPGVHYRIQTDDPRVDLDVTIQLLESFASFFDEFWSKKIELHGNDEPSRVFLFYSFYKYNQLLEGDWRFSYFRPAGHYQDEIDVLTLHTDASDPGGLADTLVHEATHQLLARRVYTGEAEQARWIAEGLATYFGHTFSDKHGGFRRGEIGGKELVPVKGARNRGRSRGRSRLETLRRMRRDAENTRSLIDVLFIDDAAAFYGNPGWNYGASWVIVHFLLHGNEGRYADTFAAHLDAERQGLGGADKLLESLEMDREAMEAALARHLRRM